MVKTPSVLEIGEKDASCHHLRLAPQGISPLAAASKYSAISLGMSSLRNLASTQELLSFSAMAGGRIEPPEHTMGNLGAAPA